MNDILLTDYSHFYFTKRQNTIVPPLRSGKFIHITHEDTEHLVFSPGELTKYHAEIVERFCEHRKIDGYYEKASHRFNIIDPVWEVRGGGRWKIDEIRKTLQLFDSSQAYGRYDTATLREMFTEKNLFPGFDILID